MGLEPMRIAAADLKPASLTNSDILTKYDYIVDILG